MRAVLRAAVSSALLAVLLSVLLSALLSAPALAQDPPPAAKPSAEPTAPAAAGQRLVYELPVDAMQRSLQGRTDSDLEQLLAATVDVLRKRVPDDVLVERAGALGFTVDVPAARAAELARVRRRVEAAGTMEMVMVADASTPRLDLPTERARLASWLDAGGRAQLAKGDHKALDAFHADAAKGPIAGVKLRWVVHRIAPRPDDPTRWQPSFTTFSKLADTCVPLFDDAQWNGGMVPAPAAARKTGPSELLELVPLDRGERSFDHTHFDPACCSRVTAPEPGLLYTLRPQHAADYAAWSEKHIGRACAIVWNGEVVAAPVFTGKIPGRGMIAGEPDALADIELALRSGALPVPPRLVREEPLPAKR